MADLSGMLSQINSTIGDMGRANGQMLGGVIANSMMPEVDPNNPQSMRKYADWARRNGKPQEAMIMEQRAMEAERTMRKKAVAEAGNRMVGQYAKAARSGEGVQEAYDKLMDFSMNAGVDMTNQVNQIDAAARAAEDQAFQKAQQERTVQRQNAQQAAIGAMAGKSEAEMAKAVASAPEQVRDIYQEAASRQMTFNKQVKQAEQEKVELKTPVSTKGIDASIDTIKDPQVKEKLKAERDALLEAKANYWDEAAGEWKTPASRRQWEQRVGELHKLAFKTGTDEIFNEKNRREDAEMMKAREISNARSNKVTDKEIETWAEANNKDITATAFDGEDSGLFGQKENNVTLEQARAAVIQERINAIEASYGNAGSPLQEASTGPEDIPAGWTTEEWNALTAEEQAAIRGA